MAQTSMDTWSRYASHAPFADHRRCNHAFFSIFDTVDFIPPNFGASEARAAVRQRQEYQHGYQNFHWFSRPTLPQVVRIEEIDTEAIEKMDGDALEKLQVIPAPSLWLLIGKITDFQHFYPSDDVQYAAFPYELCPVKNVVLLFSIRCDFVWIQPRGVIKHVITNHPQDRHTHVT